MGQARGVSETAVDAVTMRPVAPRASAIRVYYDDTLGQGDVTGAAKLLSDN